MIFSVSQAAEAAAAFSALLAAIVLAALGQIAVKSPGPGGFLYRGSVLSGFVLMVVLLVDAYMFVLLAGGSASDRAAEEGVPSDIVRNEALRFAFSGSLLAVAAGITFLFICIVVTETLGGAPLTSRYGFMIVCFGTAASMLFLVFGYDDIRDVFYGPEDPNGAGWWWHHGLALMLPLLLACVPGPKQPPIPPWPVGKRVISLPNRQFLESKRGRFAIGGALSWLIGIPLAAYLWTSNLQIDPSSPYENLNMQWVTIPSSVWAGVCFAAILRYSWASRV
jgi:hypothetical protein